MALDVGLASTKSAPQRSGDLFLTLGAGCLRGLASTKPAPQRSGDIDQLSEVTTNAWPQRSPLPKGAETPASAAAWPRLRMPQRSPLPKGAETQTEW